MRWDGSGLSSSFQKPSTITSYQNSLLVGTGEGKIKVLSKIESIADFFDNSFEAGVKGFGLHKKNEKVDQTDLEVAKNSHQKMSIYFDKCTDKIKSSFSLSMPAKLNGPQHSV